MQRLQYDVGGGEEPAVALRMERVLTRLRKCMQSATALRWLSAFISAIEIGIRNAPSLGGMGL
jgi:hypothetical protein